MLPAMRRGLLNIVCLGAVFALIPACATQDGVNNQFDANPAHAPVINTVGVAREAVIDTTASASADILDIALEPIRFFFEVSTPGYEFGASNVPLTRGMTPEERLSQRRTRMGLPQSAESRAALRQSRIRARIQK